MPKRRKFADTHASQAPPGIFTSSTLPLGVLAGVALIVLAVFGAYLPSINGGFVLDDDNLLTNNRLIKASDGLYRYWCTSESQDYWPVTYTTLWIEWRLWGMNPAGYHVTNLILHIVESLLIWIILRKLSIPGSFLAAMIFAVHPVNVESVAWISQRKNTMAMLFFLLSILCYLKYSSHPSWYWLSLVAFVLAMLSKGSVVILPVLLVGIVWWLRTRGTLSVYKRDLLRIIPFFVVAVVLAGVNVWFQTHGTEVELRTASYVERLLGAGGVVWFYLYKALLPINLVFIYPQWRIETGNPLWWLPLMAALVVTAVLWLYRSSWSRPFLFAWGFFCVSLVPAMGFTEVGFMRYSLVADRYQHIAIIGVIALASAGLCELHQRVRGRMQWSASVIAAMAAGSLIFLTWRQSGLYRDAMTLYQATLKKNPESWLAQNNLGSVLVQEGRIQEAIEHYKQALRLKPDYFDTYNNLGNALVKTGRLQEAIEQYQQALKLKSDFPEAHHNLGNALVKTGRPMEAIKHYDLALLLKPDDAETHNNLGNILLDTGRLREAVEQYEQVLILKPDYPEAHYNLGNALVQLGRLKEAIKHYEQALMLKPDYTAAYNNLGNAFLDTGRLQEAIEQYRQALRLKPNLITAYYNMALAYANLRQSSEAIATMQKALELARSQGQTMQARQIEDWLNSNRTGIGE